MDESFTRKIYTKMRNLLILSISMLFIFCTSMNETGRIRYLIVDKEIRIKKDSPYFEITVELDNPSDRSFVLYAFKRISDTALSDSLLCIERPGAGNAIFITDNEGNRMPEEFIIEMHGDDYLKNPVTEDSLYSIFRKIRSEYMDEKEVLKSGEKKNVKLKINLKSHPSIDQLAPGEYLVYFIYYAGDDLIKNIEESPSKVSLVDEALIKADQKKHKVIVFNGWVRSNQVKLIVE
jgi:hypothetical protein